MHDYIYTCTNPAQWNWQPVVQPAIFEWNHKTWYVATNVFCSEWWTHSLCAKKKSIESPLIKWSWGKLYCKSELTLYLNVFGEVFKPLLVALKAKVLFRCGTNFYLEGLIFYKFSWFKLEMDETIQNLVHKLFYYKPFRWQLSILRRANSFIRGNLPEMIQSTHKDKSTVWITNLSALLN